MSSNPDEQNNADVANEAVEAATVTSPAAAGTAESPSPSESSSTAKPAKKILIGSQRDEADPQMGTKAIRDASLRPENVAAAIQGSETSPKQNDSFASNNGRPSLSLRFTTSESSTALCRSANRGRINDPTMPAAPVNKIRSMMIAASCLEQSDQKVMEQNALAYCTSGTVFCSSTLRTAESTIC